MASSTASGEDDDFSYYAILNVERDASDDDIKKAFRQLAQAYHPDKHTDPALQAHASSNFMRLQEAYEVLSNPEKRQVYDIYGREGLAAGLEVGDPLKTTEQLRQDWETFKAQQKMQMQVAHRGIYVFKIDAQNLIDPYDRHVSMLPEVYEVSMSSQISSPLNDSTVATLGGQMAAQGNVGGGSFVCGLKRTLTPRDTLEFQGMIGLKTFASVTATRELSSHTSAGIGLTWQPRAGLGMQILSTREISDTTTADFNWVVGPTGASGVGISISRRGESLITTARIEVGAVTGISGRCIWRVNDKTSVRCALRLGTTGIDVEVGSSRRISDLSTAGLGVAVGLFGIVLKPRLSRGTHTFDFPILLSSDAREWKILMAATLLPPLTLYVTQRHIVRPLRRWHRARQRLEKEKEFTEEQTARRDAAAGANRVMEPVAKRKLRKEIQKGGLVVVDAKYGVLEAILKAEAEDRERLQSRDIGEVANGEQAASASHAESNMDGRHDGASEANGKEEDQEEREVAAAVAAKLADMQRPPPWIDVTTALRFMTEDGRLVLHHVSKRGLMGFCDPAPDEEKHLRVRFLWHRRPYTATFADKASGQLPAKGQLVTGEAEAAAIMAAAARQDLRPGDEQPPSWHDNQLFAAASPSR